jgi:hypothetical protein
MDLIELCHVIANINLHKINYKKSINTQSFDRFFLPLQRTDMFC